MANNIDEMSKEFQALSEKQAYIEAQHTTITSLNKKINQYQEEIAHLKVLLESAVPLLPDLSGDVLGSSDEEAICRSQINKLHNASAQRELTLEECRKLEIYSKVLNAVTSRPKLIKFAAKNLDDVELLKLVSNDESNGN